MKKIIYPRITLKIWSEKGKMTTYPFTTRIRRLYQRVRHGQFKKCYFKVQYGMRETNSGTKEMFYNDGTYTDKKEALKALTAFLE